MQRGIYIKVMHVFVALSLLGGGDWELRVVGREGRGEEVGVQESLGRGREDGTHTCTHTHTYTHTWFLFTRNKPTSVADMRFFAGYTRNLLNRSNACNR